MTAPEVREKVNQPVAGRQLARFMEMRGREIREAAGCLWHSVEGRFYMSIPYSRTLDPDPAELEKFLRRERAAGVRFPSRHRPGLPSGLYLFTGKKYDLSSVQIKHRQRVRKGIPRLEFRRAEESELLSQGIELNRDTMARQGRYDPEFGETRQWERLVKAIGPCPAIVPYGVFSGDRLSAFMITCREDGWLHILHQMSRLDDLNEFPNHVLSYYVTKMAAEDPELEAVSYGLMSLVNTEGLHEYKLRFGYQVVHHNNCVQLHPALAGVLGSGFALRAAHRLRRWRPADQRLEKLETVLQSARLSSGKDLPSDTCAVNNEVSTQCKMDESA